MGLQPLQRAQPAHPALAVSNESKPPLPKAPGTLNTSRRRHPGREWLRSRPGRNMWHYIWNRAGGAGGGCVDCRQISGGSTGGRRGALRAHPDCRRSQRQLLSERRMRWTAIECRGLLRFRRRGRCRHVLPRGPLPLGLQSDDLLLHGLDVVEQRSAQVGLGRPRARRRRGGGRRRGRGGGCAVAFAALPNKSLPAGITAVVPLQAPNSASVRPGHHVPLAVGLGLAARDSVLPAYARLAGGGLPTRE
mmetsp:Transcript_45781/g.120992  ORF Transcript_45781/g.120992 Transcript_45781/m.120992 type:complete len:248 (-) Transcript_45781:631-1374(-)